MKRCIKRIAVLVCTLSILTFIGCGNKDVVSNIPLEQMNELILENVKFKDINLVNIDDLKDLEIQKEWVKEGIFNVPSENSTNALFIVETNSKDDLKKVKSEFEKYANKNSNTIISTKGNYILLVNSPDNNRAVSIFEGNID